MRDMTLPPVGFGPGSQPETEDGADLAYVPMPSGMQTYQPRIPYEVEQAALKSAMPFLIRLREAALTWEEGKPTVFSLDEITPEGRGLVDEVLGEGEVSIIVEESPRIEVQESVFAGVWRIRRRDERGHVVADRIEVASMPSVVRTRTFLDSKVTVPDATLLNHPAIGNAPALFTEITDKVTSYQSGQTEHVINFTLLPHTPEDLVLIEATLGKGKTEILSRGYGNCRVSATNWPHCWWVRFYNSMDTLILDTLEIVDIPQVALAAEEDIRDSAVRLAEVMEALA